MGISITSLIEKRIISGNGLLKIPNTSLPGNRRFLTLYSQVIRTPVSEYSNVAYNPAKSRYATMSFIKGGYLVDCKPVEFKKQSWYFIADISGQNLLGIKESYRGVLQSIANLGSALGLNVISIENYVAPFIPLDLLFDSIKVVCYADTGLILSLYETTYDSVPNYSPSARSSNSFPSEVEPISPGVRLDGSNTVSLPYDTSTSDDGDTIPYVLDSPLPPPPPQGNECQVYVLNITVRFQSVAGNISNAGIRVALRGKVDLNLIIGAAGSGTVQCRCGGFPSDACVQNTLVTVVSLGAGTILEVISAFLE